ncbi:MAG: VWA domain-containing protein [Chloroflexi bacterium]|nr:VWA domain-containing protein [Chloroflexota bacterium]
MSTKQLFATISCIATLVVLSFSLATAQSPTGPTVSINYVDTTNFPEVRVYVSVLEADGTPRVNIPQGSFALSEGGTPVNLDTVSTQLDQISIVMMLDATGSMLDTDAAGNLPINLLKNSALAFIQKMSPQDVFAVYTFNDRSALRCNFTSDRKILSECIGNINAEIKDTALWDSTMDAVKKAAEIPRGRRAVVLFTDGDDNLSRRYSLDDIIRQADESDIPVYTIAAYSRDLASQPARLGAVTAALSRLSTNTRGYSLTSRLSSDLPKLFDRLSSQLKSQYVIVYTSSAAEGKTDLVVRVKDVPGNDALTIPVPSLQATILPAISQIDTSRFPDLKVFVSAPALPAGVPITPTIANFIVQEDGTRISTPTLSVEKRGALLHILVDTNADLNELGATREKIWLEERKALLELVGDNTNWLDRQNRRDIVGAETPTNDPNHPATAFSNDYNSFKNFAYSDQTPVRSQVPFDQLLRKGIDTLRQYTKDEGRRRMLVVFTNGIQPNADLAKLQDAADLAKQNNISIFVVYFGSSDASRSALTLKRIASLANWRYYWYTSLDSIKPVYQQISNFGKLYALAFRSRASASGNHVIRVSLSGGKVESSAEGRYAVDLKPPEIKLTMSGSGIVRTGNAWNSTVTDCEPKVAPVNLDLSWPDGHARKISKITYSFDNGPERAATDLPGASGEFFVEVKDLDEGKYTLNVAVEDELGQTQTTALTVPVRINLPFVGQVIRLFTRVFPILALLGSLVVLAIAVYVYRKRPPVIMGAVGALQKSVKVATDFFVRPGKGERKPAKAFLVPISGEDAKIGPIPIFSETTRLGRDDSWANIVLQDTTVSRLHAKIVEEADGNFKIYDEGSRSGTYVNDEEVQMNGQWVHEGDTVAFGKDEFQFKLKLGPKETTEIYERVSRKTTAKEDTDVKGTVPAKEDTDVSGQMASKEETDVPLARSTKEVTDVPLARSAKEETDVPLARSAKEETDVPLARSAKEETDVPVARPAKEETDVPLARSAKEETDVPLVQPEQEQVAKEEPAVQTPLAYLVPIAGTDSNVGTIPIYGETARLGRDMGWATIMLRDSAVSRVHARITRQADGTFRIYDEGSKSGTLVNNVKTPATGQLLRDGDKIILGNDEFSFKLTLPSA